LPAAASSTQIQTALHDKLGFSNAGVTAGTSPGSFTITGAQPLVATSANGTINLDVIPDKIEIGFQFPTIQGILDTLNSAMNNALKSVLGDTPVAIQGGLDLDSKVLSFDIQAHLSASIVKTLDLGSGFTDLGMQLNGTTVVALKVGLNLDVTLGLDLSRLALDTLPRASDLLSDFYLQVNQLQATGDVSVSIPHLGVVPAAGYSSANGLSIDNGQIDLHATVDVGVNAGGPVKFSALAGIGSMLTFTPHAVFSMTLPITGMLSRPGLTMSGTFTVTVHPY